MPREKTKPDLSIRGSSRNTANLPKPQCTSMTRSRAACGSPAQHEHWVAQPNVHSATAQPGSGESLPVHHPLPTTVVPRASEGEKVLNDDGDDNEYISNEELESLIAAVTDDLRPVLRKELREALQKINWAPFVGIDISALRTTTSPTPVRLSTSRTAGTFATATHQGSKSTGFANTLYAVLPACSGMPSTRRPAAAGQSGADAGYRDVEAKKASWLSSVILDGLKGLVYKALREEFSKLLLMKSHAGSDPDGPKADKP